MTDRRFFWCAMLLLGVIPAMVAFDDRSARDQRAKLDALSPEQLDQLLRTKRSFDLLSPAEQDRLRRLDAAIHAQDNHQQLMQTLRGYHEWFATLPSTDQLRILDLNSPEERIPVIRSLITEQRQRELGVTEATRLPPEDFDPLSRWARELGERKRAEIDRIFASSDERSFGGGRRGNAPSLFRLIFVMNRGGIPVEKLMELISDRDLQQLSDALSPTAAKILADRETKQDKLRLIGNWLITLAIPRVPDSDLRAFYAELDEQKRQEIDRLGPVEGRRELIRLYRESRVRRGFFRPADGAPPDQAPGPQQPPPPRPRPDSKEGVNSNR